METPQLKKCSCSRAPQSLDQFMNKNGKEVATCLKCREKQRKHDKKPERREYHNELQKEKEYSKEWRAKQLVERPEEFRQHNNEVAKEWKKNNPDYFANWSRTHVNARINALKHAAMRRQIDWHLTDEDAKEMLVKPCIYCKHIDLETRVNGIDRLDSSKPYILENCRPCCKNCNYMKGTYDPLTFIEWARQIAQCDAEFPNIPRCAEHKKVNRQRVQETQQETPTIP